MWQTLNFIMSMRWDICQIYRSNYRLKTYIQNKHDVAHKVVKLSLALSHHLYWKKKRPIDRGVKSKEQEIVSERISLTILHSLGSNQIVSNKQHMTTESTALALNQPQNTKCDKLKQYKKCTNETLPSWIHTSCLSYLLHHWISRPGSFTPKTA